MAAIDLRFCNKCNKTLKLENFYKTNNLEKYPEGYFNQCKDCLTMHVDNWNPDTFLWILQEGDVPWIPEEWNKLMANYAKDPAKVKGTTIIGRYLGKMKLKQWREYRWKDTAFLQELADSKTEQAMKRQGYDAQAITKVIQQAHYDVPETPLEIPVYDDDPVGDTPSEDNYFDKIAGGADVDFGLTEKDITYLRLKWGKMYKPEEWVKLEQLYNDMMASYDIQGAGHEDILKMVCKTSIKANQLIDIGDVDGAQKMLKMYDSMMKSGKFTAAQNKNEAGEFVDSISELVEICERDGFIPRFYIEQPNDKVDETLYDLKGYTHSLVTEEMNLGNLIENAVKEMAKQEAKEEDEDVDDDDLSFAEVDALKDDDFVDYNEFLEEEESADKALYHAMEAGDK